MNAETKFWQDTGNIDLVIRADTETELAMLNLLKTRKISFYEGTSPGERTVTLVFAAKGGKS